MKAYKITVIVVDHDDVGSHEAAALIHDARFANDCITPEVIDIQEAEIGEWSDSHPLNFKSTMEEAADRIFGVK